MKHKKDGGSCSGCCCRFRGYGSSFGNARERGGDRAKARNSRRPSSRSTSSADAAATKVQVSEDSKRKDGGSCREERGRIPRYVTANQTKARRKGQERPACDCNRAGRYRQTGIVNYSGPADEDQSLDYLITLAGKGVRILASAPLRLRRALFKKSGEGQQVAAGRNSAALARGKRVRAR